MLSIMINVHPETLSLLKVRQIKQLWVEITCFVEDILQPM